ncbi:MAG: beta/gamma crystallin-related protein [Pseudomonadota bacterium]
MTVVRTLALAAAVFVAAPSAPAQDAPEAVLYDGQGFSGSPQPVRSAVSRLNRLRFNDRASSIDIRSGAWQICEDANYRGRCESLSQGVHDLSSIGLNNAVSSIRPTTIAGADDAPQERPPIVLYSGRDFSGLAKAYDSPQDTLSRTKFNDRAQSVEVNSGVWVLCEDRDLEGRCEYVDRSVRNLSDIDLRKKVSSIALTDYEKGPDGYDVTLFAREDFRGRFLGLDEESGDLSALDFNDAAQSILVNRGSWLICADSAYRGRCEVVNQSYDDLAELGLAGEITSIQPYDGRRRDDGRRGGGRDPDYGGHNLRGRVAAFFPDPEVDGTPVDACLGREDRCDDAAYRFCRRAGYADAAFASVRRGARDTVNLRGSLACSGYECDALADVLCVTER